MTVLAKYSIIALLIVGIFSFGSYKLYETGYKNGQNVVISTQIKAIPVVQKKEKDNANTAISADISYQKGVQDGKNEASSVIYSIRNAYRVRNNTSSSKHLSSVDTNASGSVSETTPGLSEADSINLAEIGIQCNKIEAQANSLNDLRDNDVKTEAQ